MKGDQIWQVGVTLLALDEQGSDRELTFNEGALSAWVPAFPTPRAAGAAIQALTRLRFIETVPRAVGVSTTAPKLYRLTAAGQEAVKAAVSRAPTLHMASHGPMLPTGKVDPFAARLWSLLRMRKMLTAEEGAALLIDAGEPLAPARRRASELLLAWSRRCPRAVQMSVQRVKGAKRYVLIVDLGPNPPDLRKGAEVAK